MTRSNEYGLTLYTSDQHFRHKNILIYARRPFKDINHMDLVLLENLRAAERVADRLILCGDLTFDLARFHSQYGRIFAAPSGKRITLGNHDLRKNRTNKEDKVQRDAYDLEFEEVVGDAKDWRRNMMVVQDRLDGKEVQVLVSHAPQENLWGCDINVHGHIHNSILLAKEHHPEDHWTIDSPVHFCACVELHHFKAVTLDQLAAAHRNRYNDARQDIADIDEAAEEALRQRRASLPRGKLSAP
jgi:calcineurin-like phosphoesterase family protein